MPQRTCQPENAPKEATLQTYEELLAENAKLRELVHQLKEQIQILRDEIAVLKKQKPKPKIESLEADGEEKEENPKEEAQTQKS